MSLEFVLEIQQYSENLIAEVIIACFVLYNALLSFTNNKVSTCLMFTFLHSCYSNCHATDREQERWVRHDPIDR